MNRRDEEMARLSSGMTGAPAPEDVLVEVAFVPSGPGPAALAACREVVLRTASRVTDDLSDIEASAVLPAWFVEGCAPEPTDEDDARWLAWWRSLDPAARTAAAAERPWSLSAWLQWMRPQERQWWWWDDEQVDDCRCLIRVVTEGWPAPLGSLLWLIKVAGGTEVEVRPTGQVP